MIYVTGDMHGDLERFADKKLKRLKKGDILIVCGDFGFIWDDSEAEKKLLKRLSKKKYMIAFIDGAHENFELIESYPKEEWNGGEIHRITDNIIHLMRSQIYTIDEMKIFTMGGGDAGDCDLPNENMNWWSSDLPSKADLVAGAANLELHECKVDVVITHEPSTKVKELIAMNRSTVPAKVNALNSYFEELSENVECKKWFFGSMHVDKQITAQKTAVFKDIIPVDL